LTSLHPLALVGAGLSNVARAVNAASSHWFITTSYWFSKKSSIDLIFTPILPLSFGEHWSITDVLNKDFLRRWLLNIKKLISTNKLFMTYAVVIVIKRLNYIIIYWIINIKPIDPGK
jgi:hypothetical protein